MQLLTAPYQDVAVDRHVLKITVQSWITEPATVSYDSTAGTRFLLALNGRLCSSAVQLDGTFAAALSGEFQLFAESAVVIETPGYALQEPTFTLVATGKPGNLSYLDGGSNSNLIHPARSGEPCANYLYLPPGVAQAAHTHPSTRVGLILSGAGTAHVGSTLLSLTPGTVFLLPRHTRHHLSTQERDLSLLVFHPDSESGPRDEANPLKTRTYL